MGVVAEYGGGVGRMKAQTVLQQFEDGHRLERDAFQWILYHVHGCRNAKRGGGYARQTYLLTAKGLQQELAGCHLKFHLE